MPDWLVILTPRLFGLGFILAVGACVGSLVNVLAYRMPRGLSVVTPPSRCPSCQHRLTWRENVPIFGWLLLRGRCRFCEARISPQYPVVEGLVAGLFGLVFTLWVVLDARGGALGVDFASLRPEWALTGLRASWATAMMVMGPPFVVMFVLLGCFVAMTLIDAKTFTVPLSLAWAPAAVALVLLPGQAFVLELVKGDFQVRGPGRGYFADGTLVPLAEGWHWIIPTPTPTDWPLIGAALGGIAGLLVSWGLTRLGLIRRSFADYDEWERSALAEAAREEGKAPDTEGDAAVRNPGAANEAGQTGTDQAGELRDEAVRESAGGARDVPPDPGLWIRYPHARREMMKELIFLSAPVSLALLGAFLGGWLIGVPSSPSEFIAPLRPPPEAPLWLITLTGCLLGILIGGGVVWMTRVLGTLYKGQEAMGLGDVHLMAGAGACLGWIDVTLGFFFAAFVGVAWVLAGLVLGGKLRKYMPYGPFLAVATVCVLLGKPIFEWWLSGLLGGQAVDIP